MYLTEILANKIKGFGRGKNRFREAVKISRLLLECGNE